MLVLAFPWFTMDWLQGEWFRERFVYPCSLLGFKTVKRDETLVFCCTSVQSFLSGRECWLALHHPLQQGEVERQASGFPNPLPNPELEKLPARCRFQIRWYFISRSEASQMKPRDPVSKADFRVPIQFSHRTCTMTVKKGFPVRESCSALPNIGPLGSVLHCIIFFQGSLKDGRQKVKDLRKHIPVDPWPSVQDMGSTLR